MRAKVVGKSIDQIASIYGQMDHLGQDEWRALIHSPPSVKLTVVGLESTRVYPSGGYHYRVYTCT